MLTKTQEQLLAFLIAHPEEQLTIRGIAKKLNKSYTLVYNNLLNLEKQGLITKTVIPPAHIISLNKFASTDVLVNIELKRKDGFLEKHPWANVMLKDILSSTKNLFFILIVFGSYAKAAQTPKSDLDLLIIMNNKKEIKVMEDILQHIYTKVKKSIQVVDVKDFGEMTKNPNEFNIGNEARKHHIALYGVEAYYQLLARTQRI